MSPIHTLLPSRIFTVYFTSLINTLILYLTTGFPQRNATLFRFIQYLVSSLSFRSSTHISTLCVRCALRCAPLHARSIVTTCLAIAGGPFALLFLLRGVTTCATTGGLFALLLFFLLRGVTTCLAIAGGLFAVVLLPLPFRIAWATSSRWHRRARAVTVARLNSKPLPSCDTTSHHRRLAAADPHRGSGAAGTAWRGLDVLIARGNTRAIFQWVIHILCISCVAFEKQDVQSSCEQLLSCFSEHRKAFDA